MTVCSAAEKSSLRHKPSALTDLIQKIVVNANMRINIEV